MRIPQTIKGVPIGLICINFIFQRIFRINSGCSIPIHFTSRVTGNVQFGTGVAKSIAVSGGCYFQGVNGITLGDNTMIAPNVQVISANHDLENGGWQVAKPIIIGSDCWIAANVVILPEVVLGNNSIVAAGSVVTKSFPPNSIVAGVPAKLIKNRQ